MHFTPSPSPLPICQPKTLKKMQAILGPRLQKKQSSTLSFQVVER